MKQVSIIVIVVFFAAAAWAEDYVSVATSACAPLAGTSKYAQCVWDFGQQICDEKPGAERTTCIRAYHTYFTAEAQKAEMERTRINAQKNAAIERLRAKITP